jgi:hypothetical protein
MKICSICSRKLKNNRLTYCQDGCGALIKRANGGKSKEEREQRRKAVKTSWKDGAFRCYYTELELVIQKNKSESPFYFTFDHLMPGNTNRIVACAQYINDVKSDTTKNEFKHNIVQLANYFSRKQKLCRKDFRLRYFRRFPKEEK